MKQILNKNVFTNFNYIKKSTMKNSNLERGMGLAKLLPGYRTPPPPPDLHEAWQEYYFNFVLHHGLV